MKDSKKQPKESGKGKNIFHIFLSYFNFFLKLLQILLIVSQTDCKNRGSCQKAENYMTKSEMVFLKPTFSLIQKLKIQNYQKCDDLINIQLNIIYQQMLRNIVKLFPPLTRTFNQRLSIIKAKVNKNKDLNGQKVREIFEIKCKEESTQTDKQKAYLSFLATSKGYDYLQQQNHIKFLQYNKKYQIIQYTKECIAKNYKEVTPEMERVASNFFGFCFRLFFDVVNNNRDFNKSHPLWKQIADTIVSASQFYYLLPKSKKNCLLFLRTMPHQKKIIPHSLLHLNLRLTIDTLLETPIEHFTQLDLLSIVKRLYQSNIHFYYYRKSTDVVLYFWKPLKNVWFLHHEARRTVTTAMGIISFYDQATLDVMEKMLQQNYQKNRKYSSVQVINFLIILIKFGRINQRNYKEYENLIEKTIKYIIGDQSIGYYFQISVQNFYMAGIWSKSYWQAFMNFLQKDKTQQVQFYKLYVLNFLMQKFPQDIPAQIHQIAGPLRKKMIQNPNFQGKQMISDFHDKQTEPKGLSCQVQLANSLRLFNNYKILTEQLVEIFFVDILLDNKFVIEVNGSTHFIYNLDEVEKRNKVFDFKSITTGDLSKLQIESEKIQNYQKYQKQKKQYNLKSKFKTKILSKLGYYVIDMDLESYSEGSFEILSILCDFIWSGKVKEEVIGITFTPPVQKKADKVQEVQQKKIEDK